MKTAIALFISTQAHNGEQEMKLTRPQILGGHPGGLEELSRLTGWGSEQGKVEEHRVEEVWAPCGESYI